MPKEVTTPAPQQDLADRLRDLRARRKVSLEHVARAIGTTSAHLSAVERRRIENPGYKTVLALADFYGVSLNTLLAPGVDPPSRPISFDDALEHLRWHASAAWQTAIIEMAQLMLIQIAAPRYVDQGPKGGSTRASA